MSSVTHLPHRPEFYSWSMSARLRCARSYVGASREEMAEMLNMSLRSYQRIERGTSPFPRAVWPMVERLIESFDRIVRELVDPADAEPGDATQIQIWRDKPSDLSVPNGVWTQAVAMAWRIRPELIPFYAEDKLKDAR